MKTKLPLKYKKEIIRLIKEYCNLSLPKTLKVTVVWDSHETVSVDETSKEINAFNRRIKNFCDKTGRFGENRFKNGDWLWNKVLWDFRPERGDKFRISDYEWIKNYGQEQS